MKTLKLIHPLGEVIVNCSRETFRELLVKNNIPLENFELMLIGKAYYSVDDLIPFELDNFTEVECM